MNGVKIKNIEELRENFTKEIISHYRSGLLGKWLKTRGLNQQYDRLSEISKDDDFSLLVSLATIFDMSVDHDILHALLDEAVPYSGANIATLSEGYEQLAGQIDIAIYVSLCKTCIAAPGSGALTWSSSPISHRGSLLVWTGDPNYYAPGKGRVGRKVTSSKTAKFSTGDIAGIFDLSLIANDYSGDWHGYRTLLRERYAVMLDLANRVEIDLLKKSLRNRTLLLGDLINKLTEVVDKDDEFILETLRALSPEQKAMILLDENTGRDETLESSVAYTRNFEQIGAAVGGAVAGPIGALLGGLIGSLSK